MPCPDDAQGLIICGQCRLTAAAERQIRGLTPTSTGVRWMTIVGRNTFYRHSLIGVNPGEPDCLIGPDEKGALTGRMIGEACLPDGMLMESNPSAAELHSHKNDVGHPNKFDCNAWSVGTGQTKGACVTADAPPCEQSAMCKCE